jgi:hypothetical protein
VAAAWGASGTAAGSDFPRRRFTWSRPKTATENSRKREHGDDSPASRRSEGGRCIICDVIAAEEALEAAEAEFRRCNTDINDWSAYESMDKRGKRTLNVTEALPAP